MSKMAKEFAEKYLNEELNSRLKHLGGQYDAGREESDDEGLQKRRV